MFAVFKGYNEMSGHDLDASYQQNSLRSSLEVDTNQ